MMGAFVNNFGRQSMNDEISEAELKSNIRGTVSLDENIIRALPVPGTKVLQARKYGQSLHGRIVRIMTELPDRTRRDYFLKVVSHETNGREMIKGEFESLKEINDIVRSFAPDPYIWGHFAEPDQDTYFLLLEFREVGLQPPNPIHFTTRLAQLHAKSVSPTGKFGFHTTTCHGTIPQITDCWESSWMKLYQKQLKHVISLDEQRQKHWPLFHAVCQLILEKVVPRLLEPLQSCGREIKPCLLHGNLWDENTATDMTSSEPFAFDPASFYGHNEYDVGCWRSNEHRLSDKVYMRNYKRRMPASEPKDEWKYRNILYSLKFNLCIALIMPGGQQRQEVMKDMTALCKEFYPSEYKAVANRSPTLTRMISPQDRIGGFADDDSSDDLGEEEEEPEDDENTESKEAIGDEYR